MPKPEPYSEDDLSREINFNERELNALLANSTDLASRLALDLADDLISANMLRHAGNGKVSRSHQRLIQFCLFNNTSDLAQLASQVLQYGATSGGDFLLGLVCALAWYRNSILDYQKEGVNAWVDLKQSQLMPIL